MITKKEGAVDGEENQAIEDPPTSLSKRILCILAHVDHGKTTVADCLLAMAGVVRDTYIGKVRFMDSRIDEQEKGITMKTSVFSMKCNMPNVDYILTMVDTPGHVDFSKEVLSAVKSCDGALIVVDVVEGVRAQTREAIRIALEQGLKLILLINKFDRLVLELKKNVMETYEYIRRLIESCNTVVSQVCQRNELDEEEHLFRPESDNIIISSSSDGWGVLPTDVAKLFLTKNAEGDIYSENEQRQIDAIREHLFDPDCYMASDKTIKKGAIRKNRSCVFLNLVVRPLFDIYYKIGIRMHKDQNSITKICDVLKIQVTKEMNNIQSRTQINAILRAFAPLGNTIVRVAIAVVPDARFVSIPRMQRMLYDKQFSDDTHNLTVFSRMLLKLMNSNLDIHLKQSDTNEFYWENICNTYPEQPCYAYVSKIISVTRSQILPDPQLQQNHVAPRWQKRSALIESLDASAASAQNSVQMMSIGDTYETEALLLSKSDESMPLAPQYEAGPNIDETVLGRCENCHNYTDNCAYRFVTEEDVENNLQYENRVASLNTTYVPTIGLTSTPKKTNTLVHLDKQNLQFGTNKQECIMAGLSANLSCVELSNKLTHVQTQTSPNKNKTDVETQTEEEVSDDEAPVGSFATIAVVRVFYGKLKQGDSLLLLQTGYQPPLYVEDEVSNEEYNYNRMLKFKIKKMYILNGRDVIKTSEVGTGVICGIEFDHIPDVNGEAPRSGTIVNCELFYPVYEAPQLDPVLRVSVMPVEAKHMILLGNALKWLKQCDSVVKVATDENGEYVFLSSGDVHLSKITLDLKNYLNGIALIFSEPIVKIRETVLNPISADIISCIDNLNENIYRIELPDYEFFIEVFVAALPDSLAKIVEEQRDLFVKIEGSNDWGYMRRRMAAEACKPLQNSCEKCFPSVHMRSHVLMLKFQLEYLMQEVVHVDEGSHSAPYRYTPFNDGSNWRQIWSVSHYAQTECSNILWNRVLDYHRSIFDTIDEHDKRSLIDSCIVNAFHETVKSGPICGEPITRCVFAVNDFNIAAYDKIMNCGVNISTITSQITNACTLAMKGAMLKQTVRLMEPVMESEIPIASAAQTGLVINIIEKRSGKILDDASMNFDETRYGVIAKIPAINCVNFANEIRQATSGFADAFLTFSGYWMLDEDPLTKEVKIDADGDDDIQKENRAYELRNTVRKRKGLAVVEQVVASGEKQRTRSKKK